MGGLVGLVGFQGEGGLVGSDLGWPSHCCQLLARFPGCPTEVGKIDKQVILLLFEKYK